MAAANLFYNFSDLKLTPPGGSPVVITVGEIQDFKTDKDTKHEEWRASGRTHATALAIGDSNKGFSVKTGDIINAALIDPAVPYTATIVRRLYTPNSTILGKLVTVTKCFLTGSRGEDGAHNKFAMVTLTFKAIASDNDTDPITETTSTTLSPA